METRKNYIVIAIALLSLIALVGSAQAAANVNVDKNHPGYVFSNLTNVMTAQVSNSGDADATVDVSINVTSDATGASLHTYTATNVLVAQGTIETVNLGTWKPDEAENITINVTAEGHYTKIEVRNTTGDCTDDISPKYEKIFEKECFGYRGQHPLTEAYVGGSDVIYTVGDYQYLSAYVSGVGYVRHNYSVNFTLGSSGDKNRIDDGIADIPDGATIEQATLYLYYNSWKNATLGPITDLTDMTFVVGPCNPGATPIPAAALYTDIKGFGKSGYREDREYGTIAYDVTSIITGNGSHGAYLINNEPGASSESRLAFSGMALMVVYDNGSSKTYRIAHGHDRLATYYKYQSTSKYSYHVIPDDATTSATLTDANPSGVVTDAKLFTATVDGVDYDTGNPGGESQKCNNCPWYVGAWSNDAMGAGSGHPIGFNRSTVTNCLSGAGSAETVQFQETDTSTNSNGYSVVFALLRHEVNATVSFVPEDIRLEKYCNTTNVSIWIDAEDKITSGLMEFDYTHCCMNVTGYTMNGTNWVFPTDMNIATPGKVKITLNAAGTGVGPGLLHVGNITVHCCNNTGYCFTDLTWNKTGDYYLFNDAPAKIPVKWDDGTFRCNIPDLVITNMRGVEINDTHYNVSYSIKNRGKVNAGASYADLMVDGSQVETMLVPALAPGEEQPYSFASEIALTGDSDILKVCADYNDTVVEMDETNNCMVARYPGEVVISVVPKDTFVQPQDQFDVMIHVNPKGMPVYAVQYSLSYSTDVVRAETQTKGPFLGSISETIVVVNNIDQPHGETSYAESRKVTGGVDVEDNVSTIHFIAIGPRNATTTLHLHDIIISNEDGERMGYTIENGSVKITENQAPTPIGVTKHRINNVAKKYQSTAILCSCSIDPDWPGKGGNISYIRWAFGDGQYGTSEGLPVDNCTCKEHKYESWLWNTSSIPNGYDDFNVVLTVTDDGCPELSNSTIFPITVYIAGDANGDGEVNVLDVVWVGKNWRAECEPCNPYQDVPPTYCGCEPCEGQYWTDAQADDGADAADLNNDCEINVLDVVIVGANWRHVAW